MGRRSLLLVLALTTAAEAQLIRKWQTPDGKIYLGDSPPANSTLLSGEPAVGSEAPKAEEQFSGIALSGDQTQAVIRGVLSRLKDPESARFGSVAASQSGAGNIYVCGRVNARNSFGGYVGMAPFFGVLKGNSFSLIDLASDAGDNFVVTSLCIQQGIRNF